MRLMDVYNEFRSATSFENRIADAERATGVLRDELQNLERIGGAEVAEDMAVARFTAARAGLGLDEAITRIERLRDSVKDLAGKAALAEAARPVQYRR